jgi:hypothetical protein
MLGMAMYVFLGKPISLIKILVTFCDQRQILIELPRCRDAQVNSSQDRFKQFIFATDENQMHTDKDKFNFDFEKVVDQSH